jgi:hypothetical protein
MAEGFFGLVVEVEVGAVRSAQPDKSKPADMIRPVSPACDPETVA